MTNRNRLIDLLDEVVYGLLDGAQIEAIAEHLLDNGVIVPPVKVGDTVWFTPMHEGKPLGMVREDRVQVIGTSSRGFHLKLRNHQDHNKTYYFGKTVFLTKEEAEKALKERDR